LDPSVAGVPPSRRCPIYSPAPRAKRNAAATPAATTGCDHRAVLRSISSLSDARAAVPDTGRLLAGSV